MEINFHAYITKTYHEGKPLPLGTFVLKRKVAHFHFSDKFKPLQIGPYKILEDYLMLNMNSFHKIVPYFKFKEITHPIESLLHPHLPNFMRFSDSTHCDIPKPIKYANTDSSPFNSEESLCDANSSQNNCTSSQLSKPLMSPTTSSTNLFSKTNSPAKTKENSTFKQLIKTHQNEIPNNKSRHLSQHQAILPNTSFDRNI